MKLMPILSIQHIETSSDVRSGKPRISGTRMTVEDIAEMNLKLGMSLIEIAGIYDLSLAQVYAAMAYYFEHRNEIEEQVAEEEAMIQEYQKSHTSVVQAKLEQMKGE
jgi:uncharacterized protein (DUF433 family)